MSENVFEKAATGSDPIMFSICIVIKKKLDFLFLKVERDGSDAVDFWDTGIGMFYLFAGAAVRLIAHK